LRDTETDLNKAHKLSHYPAIDLRSANTLLCRPEIQSPDTEQLSRRKRPQFRRVARLTSSPQSSTRMGKGAALLLFSPHNLHSISQ
jgi:hypothetical protein